MSSNSPTQAKAIFYYETQNRAIWNTSPIEFACYAWLQEAYPDIFKEFIAVMEVSRES